MIFKNSKTGMYHVPRPYDKRDEEWMAQDNDRHYGVGRWLWMERVCSYLSDECGYGAPKDKSTCIYCDGQCIRYRGGELDD